MIAPIERRSILFEQWTRTAPMVREVVVEEEVLRVACKLTEAPAEGPGYGIVGRCGEAFSFGPVGEVQVFGKLPDVGVHGHSLCFVEGEQAHAIGYLRADA